MTLLFLGFPGGAQPALLWLLQLHPEPINPLVSAKVLSSYGATTMSAARGHAELGTEDGLAQQPGSSCIGAEAPACPQCCHLCYWQVAPYIWAASPSLEHVSAYIMCLLRYVIPPSGQCQGAGMADIPKAFSKCQLLDMSFPCDIRLCSNIPAAEDLLMLQALTWNRAGCLGMHVCVPVNGLW